MFVIAKYQACLSNLFSFLLSRNLLNDMISVVVHEDMDLPTDAEPARWL